MPTREGIARLGGIGPFDANVDLVYPDRELGGIQIANKSGSLMYSIAIAVKETHL
ncbi:MAG: hypothetical protein Aurels2KO_52540 [Aureliella sp.]